jgi:mannose/fructose-specific phosphotransferase system component IIA
MDFAKGYVKRRLLSMSAHEEQTTIPGILILSHGALCQALISSAEMINGEIDNVTAIPFEEGVNIEEYAESIKSAYTQMPPGSIVLFDLFSGTPFNQFLSCCTDLTAHGLCGASLPILLDALMFRETLHGAELVKAIEESAHDSIVNVEEFIEKVKRQM